MKLTVHSLLPIVCEKNLLSLVDALILVNSDVNALSTKGETPLHISLSTNNQQCMCVLLEAGADLVKSNADGLCFLQHVFLNKKEFIFHLVLKFSTNYNACMTLNGIPILLYACEFSSLTIVKNIIESGADFTACDHKSAGVLHYCCRNDSVECINLVELFLSRGVSIESVDALCKTPLMEACQVGNVDLVEYLLQRGASGSAADNSNMNALHFSALGGSLECAQVLVSNNGQIFSKTHDNIHPVDLAHINGHESVVGYLEGKAFQLNKVINACSARDSICLVSLLTSEFNVNTFNALQKTPIEYAIESGSIECCEILCNFGAHINIRDQFLLYYACSIGRIEVAQWLVSKGLRFSHRGTNQRTCLHVAALQGHDHIIEWLHAKNVYINIVADNDFTPLHDATAAGQIISVRCLLFLDANAMAVTKDGSNCWLLACQKGHLDIAKLLLDLNRNFLETQNFAGMNAFLIACNYGQLSIAKWLLSQGINIRKCGGSDSQNSALHLSCEQGYLGICEWLVGLGFNTSLRNGISLTCEDLAKQAGKSTIIQYLQSIGHKHDDRIKDHVIDLCEHAINIGKRDLINSLMQDILESYFNNSTRIEGAVVLNLATRAGLLKAVKSLIEYNVDVNCILVDGKTALHTASILGFDDIVVYLIQSEVDIHIRDKANLTALDYSIHNGCIVISNLLIVADFCRELCSVDIEFCHVTDISDLEFMIREKYDIDKLLLLSSLLGYSSLVNNLIASGAHQNSFCRVTGNTPLHAAMHGCHEELVIELIHFGADVKLKNFVGDTALHVLCSKGMLITLNKILDMPRSLIKFVDLNVANSFGSSLLHLAVKNNFVELVILLIKFSVKQNIVDSDNRSPLHYACIHGNSEIALSLIKAGAAANIKDNLGYTQIHYAVIGNKIDILESCVDNGIEIASDEFLFQDGDTLLHFSVKNNFHNMAKWCVRHGLDPATPNKNNRTAINIASDLFLDDLMTWFLSWQLSQSIGKSIDEVLVEDSLLKY